MLTDRQLDILAFEREREGETRNVEADVRDRFGVSLTRYVQEVHAIIETPAALSHDPMLVHRLRRLRVKRRRDRTVPAEQRSRRRAV